MDKSMQNTETTGITSPALGMWIIKTGEVEPEPDHKANKGVCAISIQTYI